MPLRARAVDKALRGGPLTARQKEAVKLILSSGERIAALEAVKPDKATERETSLDRDRSSGRERERSTSQERERSRAPKSVDRDIGL